MKIRHVTLLVLFTQCMLMLAVLQTGASQAQERSSVSQPSITVPFEGQVVRDGERSSFTGQANAENVSGSAANQAEESADAPKPALTISLQRQTIRPNEDLRGVVWVSNDSPQELKDVRLFVATPSFLKLRDGACGKLIDDARIDLGSMPAHSVLESPRELCLDMDPQGKVGDFNALFALRYGWTADGVERQSLVTSEKVVKADVIGMDSVAGVPLAFAAFIVPGIFFWLVLAIGLVPVASYASDATNKLILGVAASVVIVSLVAVLARFVPGWPWIEYFDIGSDVSIAKLAALAASGIVSGIVVVAAYHTISSAIRAYRREREQALLITPNDDYATVAQKILQLNPAYEGRNSMLVRVKDSTQFLGAHYGQTTDATFLVGSFVIAVEGLPDDVRAQMRRFTDSTGQLEQETSQLLQVLELLDSRGLNDRVQLNEPVLQRIDNTDKETAQHYLKWTNEEISSVIPDWTRDARKLLSLQ